MIFRATFYLTFTILVWPELTSAKLVFKRSDDTNPLEAVVSKLTQDVAALQAELQTVKNELGKKAAFQSTMSVQSPTPNAPIHMNVLHQVGGGYDATSGMYVIPYSGWYSVDFQLFPSDKPFFNVDLHLNNLIVARARCEDVHEAETCNSGITLHANAGDKLWIQSDFGGTFYQAAYDNLFSVVMVSTDD